MTAALRDLRADPRSRRLLLVSFAVLAVIFVAIAWFSFAYVRDLWQGRHDIAVDWDPDIPAVGQARAGASFSPDRSRFAVRRHGEMVVVDAARQAVEADLGDTVEVAWISDDVLVAFGASIGGDFEGLAVIDLADETVQQVATGGRSDNGFRPLEVTGEGLVLACRLASPGGSTTTSCTDDRFVIDPIQATTSPNTRQAANAATRYGRASKTTRASIEINRP